MEKQVKKKIKGNNGITLIALIITIIVLLILAGISLNMLTGDNSIFKRSNEAAKTTAYATAREELEVAYNSAYAENIAKVHVDREPTALQTAIKTEIDKVLAKYSAQNARKTASISINDNATSLEWQQDGNTYTAEVT